MRSENRFKFIKQNKIKTNLKFKRINFNLFFYFNLIFLNSIIFIFVVFRTSQMETGLYLPGKPLTVLPPQVSGSSPTIYSEGKGGRGPFGSENLLYILPPPILG